MRISAVGGFFVPFFGFGVVLTDTFADVIERTEEELRFMTSLKARESEGVLSAATAAKAARKAEKVEKARAADKKVEKKAVKKPEDAPAKKVEKGSHFDYELRVAAFQEAAAAQRLVQRLRKEGMRAKQFTAVSRGGQWHYVSVSFRGTSETLQAYRARLARFGLRDSMVISKTAVEEKPAKGAKKR